MLKYVGAGLSRTGTLSLSLALEQLGFKSLHFDTERLNDVIDGSTPNSNFRRYPDYDAVVDLPSAFFFEELMRAYPRSKVILTIRPIDAWWRSIEKHFSANHIPEEPRILHKIGRRLGVSVMQEHELDSFRRKLRHEAYGSSEPREFFYKRRYKRHNDLVRTIVPVDRLLVLDIAAGEGWEKLCPFVGKPIPNTPFPHAHAVNYADGAGRTAQANLLSDGGDHRRMAS